MGSGRVGSAYVADGLAVVAASPERRLRRVAVRAGQARALLAQAHTENTVHSFLFQNACSLLNTS